MQQHSVDAIPLSLGGGLHAGVLCALLIAVCFSTNLVLAQRPSLHEGVLTLPYVVSNETAYSAELSLIPDSDPVRLELIASQPVALKNSLDSSSFADNRLFVTDIDVDGVDYWLELTLIESELGVLPLFEVRDFGAHAAVVSSNQLGIETQPQWQRMQGHASDIAVGADGSVWAIGTDERGGGFGIYQWQGSSWQRVDGGAVRIDVGPDGSPWIVNNDQDIYKRQDGVWQRMGGNARDVGIGADGSVWVTSGGGTYLYDEGSWVGVRGSGERIDVDPDGIPWVLASDGKIYQLIAGRWVRRSGEARDIGIGGDGSVWIAGATEDDGSRRIYRWTGTAWNRVVGSAREISVGPEGYPWITNSDADIYRGQ